MADAASQVDLFVPAALASDHVRHGLEAARLVGKAETADRYRVASRDDQRRAIASDDEHGVSLPGELYALDLASLDVLLNQGSTHGELGVVELSGGSRVLALVSTHARVASLGAGPSLENAITAPPQGQAGSVSWHHTSLAVITLDEAVDFYRVAFGYEPIFVERGMSTQAESIVGLPALRCDLAQLRSPISNHTLELIAFRLPEGAERRGPTLPGEAHVAFLVTNLDDAVETARSLGAVQLGEVTQFDEGRAVYMTEPSGTAFELSERGAKE